MKKLILVFMVALSGFAFGQFTITDTSDNWEKVGNNYAHLYLYQKKDKSKSKIQYRDFESSSNTNRMDFYEFEFSSDENTLDKLYQICKDHFSSKKVETLTLEFPEGKMIMVFDKALGSYYCNIKFEKTDNNETPLRGTGPLAAKVVDRLFGKIK